MSQHILVTSTGRAGTSFLVQLFSAMALDTGYTLEECERIIDPTAHAGLDRDPRRGGLPYIFKNVRWVDFGIEYMQDNPDFGLDHAILCVRDINQTVASRIRCHDKGPQTTIPANRKGGLTGTDDPAEQEEILLRRQWELMRVLAASACQTTIISFPEMVRDSEYLEARLDRGFHYYTATAGYRDRFMSAFNQVAKEEWVHG